MDSFVNRNYYTLNDGEWNLFLEAYRSYELQNCHHAIYLSGLKKDGEAIREQNERRIEMLKNASYQKLFADFGANFTESIEIELETEGHFDFFKLFEQMFTKKRSL
ncbi:hypothetical protein [Lysinibacillus fusiformis]|uniref:hypothetical protein n=1 Tax=Lysinibacillus fusiformis TaxID=28031 RepID=UPI00124681F3|nr:hypothetical protein [Lysinibacillus fusiformis]KAB0443268.1 hypothetical protein CH314_06420 [Lysinibacillus fusiformis]